MPLCVTKPPPIEGSYYIYLAVFATVVVPLSCMELSEQIYTQVTLSLFRVLMLSVMILTTAVSYFRYTILYYTIPLYHLYILIPIYLYILIPIYHLYIILQPRE
jgi:hypothetical protein